jgi:capsule biosynthesis phosphatase
MTYVFDIDGTICTISDSNYYTAQPYKNRIKIINNLYDQGNKIILLTARGMGRTNNDAIKAHNLFYCLTVKQLDEWGVKYHSLFMGKPAGDYYVDDKGIKDENFFNTRD